MTQAEFFAQIRAVVAEYLDGEEGFDAAAVKLAAVLRNHVPSLKRGKTGKTEHSSAREASTAIKPEEIPTSTETFMVFESVPMAPGRSPEDERKASTLFGAASRLARSRGGDAA